MTSRSKEEILNELTGFVSRELLQGQNISLDASTPLLEWGVIDSISLLTLVNFIEERLGTVIAAEELRAENFATLEAMTALVRRCSEEARSA